MHRRQSVTPAVQALAELQAGIVTREQAIANGLGRRSVDRLVAQGLWGRLVPGVYTTTPHRTDFEAQAWAAVLAAGDDAMLVGQAAGHLLGICPTAPREVVVAAPQGVTRQMPPGCRLERRRRLPLPEGLLPHTPATWTVLDLCADAPDGLVSWVTTALRLRLTTSSQLRAGLEQRDRLPSGVRRKLLVLLCDADGLESPLEHLFTTTVLIPHGLPHGERQFRRNGRQHDLRIGRLLIELDGRLGHADVTNTFRDMDRDNWAAAQGMTTLRYGYDDCWLRPCDAAAQIDAVLRQLDYPTAAHRCHSCAV